LVGPKATACRSGCLRPGRWRPTCRCGGRGSGGRGGWCSSQAGVVSVGPRAARWVPRQRRSCQGGGGCSRRRSVSEATVDLAGRRALRERDVCGHGRALGLSSHTSVGPPRADGSYRRNFCRPTIDRQNLRYFPSASSGRRKLFRLFLELMKIIGVDERFCFSCSILWVCMQSAMPIKRPDHKATRHCTHRVVVEAHEQLHTAERGNTI
jgi:hypothetical protein